MNQGCATPQATASSIQTSVRRQRVKAHKFAKRCHCGCLYLVCMFARDSWHRLLTTLGRCLSDDTWRTFSRNMLPLARNGHAISLKQSSSRGAVDSMLRAWQARGAQARQVRCCCVAAGQSKYASLSTWTEHHTTGNSAVLFFYVDMDTVACTLCRARPRRCRHGP